VTDKKEPQTEAEWFERGRECFHKPDGLGAVRAFERVIDLDPAYCHPDGDTPYFYLGKIHEIEGRMDSAIVHYSRALAINPHDEESLIGRGSCYTVTRQHEAAIEDFSKLLAFPKHLRKVPRKHLYYVIAENYRQMKDWGQALYWAQKAHHADPGNHRHQELLKEMMAKLKQDPPSNA
jgi:tetratricopeptide (TPR) repeat protein